jgi:hypothetical protein
MLTIWKKKKTSVREGGGEQCKGYNVFRDLIRDSLHSGLLVLRLRHAQVRKCGEKRRPIAFAEPSRRLR